MVQGISGGTSSASAQEPDECEDEKDDEADLRDPSGRAGDAGETEDGCDERHHQKDYGVMEHGSRALELGCVNARQALAMRSRIRSSDSPSFFCRRPMRISSWPSSYRRS